jgi:hypothetical protein
MFLEVVPKIAYHLDFLISNPDIKILVRALNFLTLYEMCCANMFCVSCLTILFLLNFRLVVTCRNQ